MGTTTVGIIVIAKPPEAGESKTRLAVTMGDARALRIYSRLLENALTSTERVKVARRFVYTYGDGFCLSLKARGFGILQDMGHYSLADKVEHAFSEAFADVDGAVMTITDDVFLSGHTLTKAVRFVKEGRVVLGPTLDGGLYLIGISRDQVDIVRSLPFGRDNLCNTLVARATRQKHPVSLLEMHVDIDSEEHLKRAGELGQRIYGVPLDDLL